MDYLHQTSPEPPSAPVLTTPVITPLEPTITPIPALNPGPISVPVPEPVVTPVAAPHLVPAPTAVVPAVSAVVSSHVARPACTLPAAAASALTASPPTPSSLPSATSGPPVPPARPQLAEQREESPVHTVSKWPFDFGAMSPPKDYEDIGGSRYLEEVEEIGLSQDLEELGDDFNQEGLLLDESLQDLIRNNPIPTLADLYSRTASSLSRKPISPPHHTSTTFLPAKRPQPCRINPLAQVGFPRSSRSAALITLAQNPPPPLTIEQTSVATSQLSGFAVTPSTPDTTLVHAPDLTICTAHMSAGYHWLISNTESWGSDWTDSVKLFMELHQLSGFPVSCTSLIWDSYSLTLFTRTADRARHIIPASHPDSSSRNRQVDDVPSQVDGHVHQ